MENTGGLVPRRLVVVPALAAAAAAMPLTIGASGGIEVREACAQGGVCIRSPGDICFYNGVAYYDTRCECEGAGG